MTAVPRQAAGDPRVSVIMAAHNAEAYVGPALRSLLAQTMEDFEIIVVDDASTDSTARIVNDFDDDRVVLVSLEENRGAAAARNAGLKRARGVYIAIMDADDLSRRDRLAIQADFLAHHPGVDVAGSQIRVVDAAGRVVARRSYPTASAAILRAMPRWNPIAHSTVMVRAGLITGAGGYDESATAAHDYALWSRLARRGAVFVNLPDTLVDYRIHRDTIKKTQLRRSLQNTLVVQRQYWTDARRPADLLYRTAEMCLLRMPESFVSAAFVFARYLLPTAGGALKARVRPRTRSAATRRHAS